jgi:hypothetical protein
MSLAKANLSNNIFEDKDQDGLLNSEELAWGTNPDNPDSDGDGYSDGVEVKSGYDPLKPAPGDKIIEQTTARKEQPEGDQEKANLTDEFIAALEKEKKEELDLLQQAANNPEAFSRNKELLGRLQQASITPDEINKIINETVQEANIQDEMKLIPEDEIKVLPAVKEKDQKKKIAKEKEQIERYLASVAYVLAVNSPFEIKDKQSLPDEGIDFVNQATNVILSGNTKEILRIKKKAQAAYEQVLLIETPYVLKDFHRSALSIYHYLADTIDEKKLADQNDPLAITMYLGKMQAAFLELNKLAQSMENVLKKYDIKTIQLPITLNEEGDSVGTSVAEGEQ